MKTIYVLTASLLLLLLTACAPGPSLISDEDHGGGFVKYEIRLVPDNNGTIRLPGARNCARGSGNRMGCVRFEAGTYGAIIFSVGGNGQDNRMCGDSGVNWVITRVEITDTGDIDSEKGTGFGTSLDPWLQSALFPFEDVSQGIVYDEQWDTGKTTVGLLNRNDNDASTPRDFWYKVTATRCRPESDGTHRTSVTDPRVENDGR